MLPGGAVGAQLALANGGGGAGKDERSL